MSKRCSSEDFDKEAKKICDEYKMNFKLQEVFACVEPFEEQKDANGELIKKRCKLANYNCVPKPKEEPKKKDLN